MGRHRSLFYLQIMIVYVFLVFYQGTCNCSASSTLCSVSRSSALEISSFSQIAVTSFVCSCASSSPVVTLETSPASLCCLQQKHDSQSFFNCTFEIVQEYQVCDFSNYIPEISPSAFLQFFFLVELLFSLSRCQLCCNCCHLFFSGCQAGGHH